MNWSFREMRDMLYGILADIVVVFHFLFVLFAVMGGLCVLKWPRVLWAHLPAALWAAAIEFGGWLCPLTPLENWLRMRAGKRGYSSGFVEHHILPLLYPGSLTRELQIILGVIVLAVNLGIYGLILSKMLSRCGGAAPKQR
jgi:hypothetical protein